MFLLVDKPKGITSHDVIDKVRKITGIRRTGHAGTLDPNATGLLIVGVGRESTKELWTKFGKLDKTYVAEITLGEEREGDDITGKFLISKSEVLNKSQFTKSQISRILKGFIGEQMQIPPIYSAIKVKGQPAYKLARKGGEVELKPRKITIYSIKLLDYKYPVMKIETRVSSGTYVRSLARDIGQKLGCGAFLSELRRVKIGKYKLDDSVTLEQLPYQFPISKS